MFKIYKIILCTLKIIILVIIIFKSIAIQSNDIVNNILQKSPIKLSIVFIVKKNNKININKINNLNINNIIIYNSKYLLNKLIIYKQDLNIFNEHIIFKKNNLNNILNKHSLNAINIALIFNQNKELHNSKISKILIWDLNKKKELQIFIYIISTYKIHIYNHKKIFNIFNKEKKKIKDIYIYNIIGRKINSNFIISKINFKLIYNEVFEIYKILQYKINLLELKSNNKFSILLNNNILNSNNKQSKLLRVYLLINNKNYYIFLVEKIHFYNRKSNFLKKSFLRYPINKFFRISSNFSMHRINPVTGYLLPHKGIDFSIPIGTPILSVNDGKVIVVKYSKVAGNFIVIKHDQQYTTRYMHLHKLLVKLGQKVKKGECIALSGNTGRTTGPHLHYELLFNNHAINPLTSNLSNLEKLIDKNSKLFLYILKK
ncbi:MAG: murein DD-endopeptidase MepM [Arsenophonus endosymbiont of Ceratovacuna japonica]